ncbi:hypothetical protein RJ639_007876 [Escallonia herrerae]|uniref:Uncharacterized protein n=1 Tax=Escallonia herrerae TaxID=1293975 RepID=A0AA89AT03_9ASTE|nr:hypothetical protein RJ639_007876 [Escallonia herrerae]
MAGQIKTAHAVAICSLIAAVQRCAGLWQLQEVMFWVTRNGLNIVKLILFSNSWNLPEIATLDLDTMLFVSLLRFILNWVGQCAIFGCFSAATGKRSLQHSESEEIDPDWGCWSASQELRNPSIKILFRTIERVKSASSGILASKYILCFSVLTVNNKLVFTENMATAEKRSMTRFHFLLTGLDIRHMSRKAYYFCKSSVKAVCTSDAVARRRFQSKADSSSFGWVYCGSHNFSAAAWGRPLSNSLGIKSNRVVRNNPVLASRLHILNYKLGIIFIVPPLDTQVCTNQKGGNLDEIVLPFTVPAPKYRPGDGPATKQAMREALAALAVQDRARYAEATSVGDLMEEEIPDEEEEGFEVANFITVEKEDDKAYAETLWSQVDSSESC